MSEATAALTGDNGGADAGAAGQGAPEQQQGASTQPQVWSSKFDEDTQAYVNTKGWKSETDMLQSYRNLEKYAGGSKNLVELPGVDADDSAWDGVYAKLGRPDSPDQYELNKPDNADPELTNWFKQTAHQLGLNSRQASSLFDAWNNTMSEKMQAMQEAEQKQSEQQIGELKKEWGRAFDQQIAAGKHAVNALGYKAEQLNNIEAKLGTAETLKLFATIGSKMGEPSFEGGDRTGEGFGVTPAAARQQIADLKMDKNFMDQYIGGNPDAVAKMKRLMEFAYE